MAPMSEGVESLYVVEEGEGAPVLFVHGSAADHTTWTMQRAFLKERLRLLLYDRRGTGQSRLPEGREFLTLAEHAADAAWVAETHGRGAPVVGVGSSFGGVVLLELARRRPELLRGLVLIEPPLPPADDRPPVALEVFAEFERLLDTHGGRAAAEHFLRFVLGDAAWERVPRAFQDRSRALWRAIRRDCLSLDRYRADYAALARVELPVLLLGGERSSAMYRPTLEALARTLPRATLELVPGGGHTLHADVFRRFNARLLAFAGA